MNKEQYTGRFRNLQLEQAELDRKWRLYHEEMRLLEAMSQVRAIAAANSSSSGGGPIISNNDSIPEFLIARAYAWFYVDSTTNTWWTKILNYETKNNFNYEIFSKRRVVLN